MASLMLLLLFFQFLFGAFPAPLPVYDLTGKDKDVHITFDNISDDIFEDIFDDLDVLDTLVPSDEDVSLKGDFFVHDSFLKEAAMSPLLFDDFEDDDKIEADVEARVEVDADGNVDGNVPSGLMQRAGQVASQLTNNQEASNGASSSCSAHSTYDFNLSSFPPSFWLSGPLQSHSCHLTTLLLQNSSQFTFTPKMFTPSTPLTDVVLTGNNHASLGSFDSQPTANVGNFQPGQWSAHFHSIDPLAHLNSFEEKLRSFLTDVHSNSTSEQPHVLPGSVNQSHWPSSQQSFTVATNPTASLLVTGTDSGSSQSQPQSLSRSQYQPHFQSLSLSQYLSLSQFQSQPQPQPINPSHFPSVDCFVTCCRRKFLYIASAIKHIQNCSTVRRLIIQGGPIMPSKFIVMRDSMTQAASGEFKCDLCPFSTQTGVSFMGHMVHFHHLKLREQDEKIKSGKRKRSKTPKK